jgi:hypothetical protein
LLGCRYILNAFPSKGRYKTSLRFKEREFHQQRILKTNDFLAPEYGGAPKRRRHQVIQDMLARKGRGTDIVFDQTEIIHLSGPISSGANIELDIKVANVTACFVMKGIALGERTSEKDAYDLYMLARYYKEGPQSVLSELNKLGSHGLMKEASRNMKSYHMEIDWTCIGSNVYGNC